MKSQQHKRKYKRCGCTRCRHKTRKRRRAAKTMGRDDKSLRVTAKLSARRRGRRVEIVDQRGRVHESFLATKRGSLRKREARRRFNSRSARSKRRDLRQTARHTTNFKPSKRRRREQALWYMHPNEYDIKGVDTRMGRKPERKFISVDKMTRHDAKRSKPKTKRRRRRTDMGMSRSRRGGF